MRTALLIALVLFLVAVVVAVVILLLRARRKRMAAAGPAQVDHGLEMQRLFAAGRRLQNAASSSALSHAAAPRLLLLGLPDAGKSTLIAGAGLKPRSGPAPLPLGNAATCQLWLFERAVVIEPAGRTLVGEPRAEGQAPDTGAFDAMLDAARRDRPERPIDGIIVAVSAADLLDPEGAPQDLRRTAALLRRRVDEAQRRLGMQAPIFLVVTQSDRVAGFDNLVEELDPSLHQAMLGWSNPRSPAAEVTAACVDEALDSMGDALALEQARRLAAERSFAGDAEAYLLFPEALDALRTSLRAYAEELLLPMEGGEPTALRGIYLVGTAEPGASAEPSPGRPVLFAREMLERKILAEANLARPGATALQRRRRTLLALHAGTAAFALIYGGVLAIATARVAHHATLITPFLDDLQSALLEIKPPVPLDQQEISADVDPAGQARLARSAYLLKKLSEFETDRLRSAAVPGSWLSSIDDRLEQAIAKTYRRILLDAFHVGLDTRARQLASLPLAAPLGSGAPGTLDQTPEYRALQDWLAQVAAFEANVARYDTLVAGLTGSDADDTTRLRASLDLTGYLVQEQIGQGRSAGYHERALLRLTPRPPFNLGPHRNSVQRTADELFSRVGARVSLTVNEAKLRSDVEALKTGLEALGMGGAEYRTDKLDALQGAILRTEGQLAAPTLSWVGGGQLPMGEERERLLRAVRASRLLDGKTYGELKQSDLEQKLKDLQRYLTEAETAVSGRIFLDKEGTDQLALGTVVSALKEPTGALLRQRFMAPTDEEDPVPEDLDGARLSWDLEMLKDAVKLLKGYEAYVQSDGLKPFPEKVRGTVTELSTRNLKDNVLVTVGKAARREIAPPPSETRLIETVRADVVSLAQASEALREILAASGRIGLEEVRERVRSLLRGQGARLLNLASRVLATESLYEVKGNTFAWWNGERPPVFEAFGVSDAARLAEYLIIQRGRIDSLTHSLADPVLGLLESAEVGAETAPVEGMKRWQRITSALRDYESKKPGNSVGSLERFLLTDLPAITFENCLEQLGRAPVDVETIDLFSERRRGIHALLFERCATLAEREISEKYPRLRRFFARALADRFPFAKIEPGVDREDANPDDVRLFIQNAADFRKRYRGVLAVRGDSAAQAVVRFLDRMEKVREFMDPMWGAGESSADGRFDVNVAFRVNRGREVAGNQVAEWSLRFADERVTMDGPKPTATWRIGDPPRLQLRWAKNSPDIPLGEQDPGVLVKERLVTFEQKGTWALLRLIATHRTSAEDAESKEDSSSNVLQLVVFTIPDPAGGWVERVDTPEVGGVARVFVRLGLTGKEKDKPLKYPDFPTTAPMLDLE
ncbi:type VI secretion system protein [Chondromyces apiculatus]|uniref:Type VI secretion system component TssM1 N-terminal domain-containing protein n=1 Tax=Chondromyces apiculatus DSM 436 TaxID=1192034 RepID=A0A017T1I1_9BACT|nr:type VI secretion system protein [Chondromyces apiculatus]EYF02862.1 Hypothetical protein CAP_6442 [Chondromyces apiculatus DSM 436]